MTTDMNRCGNCGWERANNHEDFNPRRMKCPDCGAEFLEREEFRWFL